MVKNKPFEKSISSNSFDLRVYLKKVRKKIDAALIAFFDNNQSDEKRIVNAMQYSLMVGGKRLRPILCLATAEAVYGDSDNAITAACALEMIHTYSLIHDDLPAMDNDEWRRDHLTCHVKFDEATAILAGNGLLTMAFQILSDKNNIPESCQKNWLDVIHVISNASGYIGMIEGQMRDILSEGKKLTLNELEELHKLKTGAIIKASVISGAIIGGAGCEKINQLEKYAANIGLAFQVADDILNIEGDPQIMGKAIGTDEAHNKATYPSLMGMEESKRSLQKLIDNALLAIKNFDENSEPLRAIAQYIMSRKR